MAQCLPRDGKLDGIRNVTVVVRDPRANANAAVSIQWTGILDWTTGLTFVPKIPTFFGVYPFAGLDHWTGLMDWTTGLKLFSTHARLRHQSRTVGTNRDDHAELLSAASCVVESWRR